MNGGNRLVFSLARFIARFSTLGTVKMGPLKRGALIVLEGCDRSGKTSQANHLWQELEREGYPCQLLRFPDRTTVIGQMIDSYLSKKTELEDHVIHHLFSANRWELAESIKSKLLKGTNILIDRYAYSGVAFSAAKDGMDLEWCKQADVGLPCPDLVLFLDIEPCEAAKRCGFGEERYENLKFQNEVYSNYLKLVDDKWKKVNANQQFDAVQLQLINHAKEMIKSVGDKQLAKLWVK